MPESNHVELWRCEMCIGKDTKPPCERYNERADGLCAIEIESESYQTLNRLYSEPHLIPELRENAISACWSRFIFERLTREQAFLGSAGLAEPKQVNALVNAAKNMRQHISQSLMHKQSLGLLQKQKDESPSGDTTIIVLDVRQAIEDLAATSEGRVQLREHLYPYVRGLLGQSETQQGDTDESSH